MWLKMVPIGLFFYRLRSTIYQKNSMKLSKSLVIVGSVAQDPKAGTTCDLRALNLVDMANFDYWDCNDEYPSSSNKPRGTKCWPVCEKGYEEYLSKCYFYNVKYNSYSISYTVNLMYNIQYSEYDPFKTLQNCKDNFKTVPAFRDAPEIKQTAK